MTCMAKCGHGKIGASQQKQLLTLLMKPTISVLSRSNVKVDFALQIERVKQNFLTLHRKDDKEDFPISEFIACYAVGKIGEK